ncbi:phosphotransferase, partial [Chitinivibrio alkaliphilus]|uniref:phosphotransferase n=1 Tax=Chitinivibrio alkaliphilus TaxID=1505232 RepID=UPI00138ACF25
MDWAGTAGSGRAFYRITTTGNRRCILMVWNPHDPDWDFFLALHETNAITEFSPALLGYDRPLGVLLVADGGARRLKDILFSYENEAERLALLKDTFALLHRWHTKMPRDGVLGSRAFTTEYFLWESSYCKTHCTELFPHLRPIFNVEWDTECAQLAQKAASHEPVLVHRDLQSENILVQDGEITFVDIQGARLGPAYYDVASLLYDPYIAPVYTETLRISLKEYLRQCYPRFSEELFAVCAMQRLLQALGAYANLYQNKQKHWYAAYIYPAAMQLEKICEEKGYSAIAAAMRALSLECTAFLTKK